MKINQLDVRQTTRKLRRNGLQIKIGPFWINLRSPNLDLSPHITYFYGQYETKCEDEFCDFHIKLVRPGGIRRWVKPQVSFLLDEYPPFKPLPSDQAFAMFEWGLNWCIATTAHRYLIVHAAVIEKGGQAIIMPGVPGAGKSTLCAAMSLSGWRMLSDEMALLDADSLQITPVPRPVSLKNESIEVIERFSPGAAIGPKVKDTAKGTIAHLRPLTACIEQADRKCMPGAVVFPSYKRGSQTCLRKKARNRALLEIQENAFNTHVLGTRGFSGAKLLVDDCPVYSLEYTNLDQALRVMDEVLTNNAASV